MKGLPLVLFGAVLVLQSASAFPKSRVRRDAQSQPDLNLSANTRTDKNPKELLEYVVEELVGIAKRSINSHKKLFGNVLKYADEAELKSDVLKEQLAKFSNMVGQANSLPEEETAESLEKLFNLFGDCIELVNKYDELASPTEEEKQIKRILGENSAIKIISEISVDLLNLRSYYKAHNQKDVDSLSEGDTQVIHTPILQQKFSSNRVAHDLFVNLLVAKQLLNSFS